MNVFGSFFIGSVLLYFLTAALSKQLLVQDRRQTNTRIPLCSLDYTKGLACKFNGVVSRPHFSMTILIQIVEKCSQHCSSSLFEPLVRVLLLKMLD